MKTVLMVVLLSVSAFAQTPKPVVNQSSPMANSPNISSDPTMVVNPSSPMANSPNISSDPTIKDTPASQALIETAKKFKSDQQVFNTALQQAKTAFDQNVKALQAELAKQQKALHDNLLNDKKYKDQQQHIDDLNKQIADAGNEAQRKFNAEVGTVSQNANLEQSEVNVLIPIVRRENDLPDNAAFSIDTQKWTVPGQPATPAESKSATPEKK